MCSILNVQTNEPKLAFILCVFLLLSSSLSLSLLIQIQIINKFRLRSLIQSDLDSMNEFAGSNLALAITDIAVFVCLVGWLVVLSGTIGPG